MDFAGATAQNLSANYSENVNETVLSLRLSTKEHLDEIEKFLRSVEQFVDIDKDTGKRVYSLVQVSEPLANPEGIKSIMFIVRNVMNQHIVQGNFIIDDLKDYIFGFRRDLASNIMENINAWGIKESNYNFIIDTIMNFVKPFMTRTINNKERESYSASLQMRETNSVNNKRGFGLFN